MHEWASLTKKLSNESPRRRLDLNWTPSKRIKVFQSNRAQTHRRRFARTILRRSVHRVANNRHPSVRKMNSDLMRSPRERARFDESKAFFAVENFE
jgi:hypothetical protein